MTAKQFLLLGEDPPGIRLELVDGEVFVSPSPTPAHARAIIKLAFLLEDHIERNHLGELFGDVDTILDRFTVRRPDLLFFSAARRHFVGKMAMEGPPDLAIEVISPSSIAIDREDKFEEYRKAGVTYYWMVDPAARTMEGWELREGQYQSLGKGSGGDVMRLAPFADLQLPLARLWGTAD